MASIGMELAGVSYWSTESPFLDRFKTSATWVATNGYTVLGDPVTLDSNGYPTSLPKGATNVAVQVGVDSLSTSQPSLYTLTYKGTASFQISGGQIVSSKPGEITFKFTDPTNNYVIVAASGLTGSDPLSAIHLVRTDQLDLFNSGKIFNPDFLAKASGWSTLRFMDWEATNSLTPVTWNNRTTVSDASWAAGSSASGVPLEVMVELANEAHTDMWFNVPTEADNDYVKKALTYIRDNLDPSLKVKVEYSNEMWNWGFDASRYAQTQANALWGKDVTGDGKVDPNNPDEAVNGGWMIYYGYRSAQVAAIANSVFTGNTSGRLVDVLSTQTAYTGIEQYTVDGIGRANVGTVANLFDEYAVTTYFGNALSGTSGNAADQQTVLGWARSGAAGLTAAFKELTSGGALSTNDSLANLTTLLVYQEGFAQKYGLDLVAYEGGAHLTASSFPAAAQGEVTDFISRLMNDPRMGTLYTQMIDAFTAAGGTQLNAFADAGTSTANGYWGVLDNIYQKGSARYDALKAASTVKPASSISPTPTGGTTTGMSGGATITSSSSSSSSSSSISTSLASYTLAATALNLTYTGSAAFTGTGNALANVITGGSGADKLDGGDGADTLIGGAGNDLLDGGTGADRMTGGAGNDIYLVDNAGDSVIEDVNAGTDEVRTTLASYTLGANVENLTYTGTAAFTGTGNALANVITGGSGTDKLYGGDGADTLIGGAGNDLLDGGIGADRMTGGAGNDIYVVDNAGDSVFEDANAGTDEVRTTLASYTLGANVENLTYTGSAAFTGTGNALANIITGGNGADTLYGGDGADTLIGGAGNDTLDGGSGIDRMIGGAGDDFYYVDDSKDTIVELAMGGTDRVASTVNFTLPDQVEELNLVGTAAINGVGNAMDNVLRGNDANNVLYGMAGADTLAGGGGADTLAGGDGNDVLLGQAGNDTLFGDAGNDWLDGGAGADVMKGGTGDDSYVVDDRGDQVIELAGEGYDSVTAQIDYTLTANVEVLYLSGTAKIGTGNALDNFIVNQTSGPTTLYGLGGNDQLVGGIGNDILYGGDGNDTLSGGAGDDILDGGAGVDVLQGGLGADRFRFLDGGLGSTLATADRITDFSRAEGDRIDLSAMDANSVMQGRQAFNFIGTGAFTKKAGELRTTNIGGTSWAVQADTNGDGIADIYLMVSPLSGSLIASDFILA